ncbi:S1C family serine protease [Paraliobacillus sp. PM-2]|uniref:S1C family serine protease n=1 Tax=Paraliobacillus sp. PM-2 TaxID=1462524 RepID=UPI00210041FA|nr:serine protease [Paraliobacillus sp. PM-2]
MSDKRKDNDMIDDDLYEELDEEELLDIFEKERVNRTNTKEDREKMNRRYPRWILWSIIITLSLNVIAILPRTFSIPAVDFLITSAKLSTDSTISEYKEAVVVIETGDSKGTGFSISPNGIIITNHHVVEDSKHISVAFPELGLFEAEIIAEDASVDLAVLQVNDVDLPYLSLAQSTVFEKNEPIYFIGNPLRFNGIANQGEIIGYTTLDGWDKEVLMLRAPVYRGNSGSPVIQDGKVIGVIFATINHHSYGKVGLAVPIDYYYQFIDSNT